MQARCPECLRWPVASSTKFFREVTKFQFIKIIVWNSQVCCAEKQRQEGVDGASIPMRLAKQMRDGLTRHWSLQRHPAALVLRFGAGQVADTGYTPRQAASCADSQSCHSRSERPCC